MISKAALLLSSATLSIVATQPALAQAIVALPAETQSPSPPPDEEVAEGTVVPLPQNERPVPSQVKTAIDPDANSGAAQGNETDSQSEEETGTGVPLRPDGRPDINPYDRDLQLTVPLIFGSRTLGDIPILMTADDRIFLDSAAFVDLLDTTLNDDALVDLSAGLEEMVQFQPEDLEGTGVSLTYDPSTLSVVLVEVAPERRAIVDLFAPPREDSGDATLLPSQFSGYLNLGVIQTYVWEGSRADPPTVTFDGAVRVGAVVFEADGQVGQQLGIDGDSYRFTRNFARLVYDEPESFRRWFAGDLDPEIRGQQTFVSMGGVGVLRQARRFNGFRAAILQANRQLVLQRESTVRFLRNGALFREVRLQPGRYDFSQLPLLAGSNDIDIQVTDLSGGVQNLSYQQYLDPIDLDPGDYEYGFYAGPTSDNFAGAPDYRGPMAISGFYRKAFINRPALGIGVQASEAVQTVTSQIQFVLGNSGRLLLDGGVSTGRDAGEGFAAGVSYDHFFDRGGLADSLTARADYVSQDFSSLGNPEGVNANELSVSGQYTRQFSLKWLVTGNVSYLRARDGLGDSYRLGLTSFYRINRKWTFRAGAEYTRFPEGLGRGSGFNVTAGIIFQPDFRRRAEARFESRNNLAELSYNQSGLNQLNSLGFGGVLSTQDDSVLGQGFLAYSANRFDIQASHASFGPEISQFAQTNISSVRVGTTLAFAGDQIGVGRRINDSFILFKAHPNLKGRSVVAGQSLAQNNFISKSGPLGSAVNNFLGSYAMQTVQYDVEDPPVGYDTGTGIFRVFPPYKSGYAAEIGTDAFVTAMGTFLLAPDQPVSLVGGRVTLLDVREDENPEPIPFFTNSAGRFAIANLLPGRRYLVETYGKNGVIDYTFEFAVPEDTDGLVRMGEVLPGARIGFEE